MSRLSIGQQPSALIQGCTCSASKPHSSSRAGSLSRVAPGFKLHRAGRCSVTVAAAATEERIETVEEIENAAENQSTDTLYQRFEALLDQTMQDYDLGDRVMGIVSK